MNSNEWNEIVNSNDCKIYHRYEWGKLINEVHGHDLIYLDDNNGIFPLAYIKSHIFGNRLISLPFADYGGPCTNDMKTADTLIEKAANAGMELDVDFIEIRSPRKEFFNIFENHGFIKRDEYFSFILDLQNNEEKLWEIVGKKNRNMIRKAQKSGIEIAEAKNINDLRIFYGIYLKTMKKLGSPPQPYIFFRNIWDMFYPGSIIILLAKYNNIYLGGSLFFMHNDTIHHAYNCSLKEHLGFGQNNLIQWHIIESGHKKGFKYLDFGRTRENAGNLLFKKRWGGEIVNMPYYYKFIKKELKQRDEIKYERLSKLWTKYVPEFMANMIGPWIIKQIG